MIEENKRLSSIIKDLSHALKTANKEKEVLKQKLIDNNAAKCLEIQRLKETLTNAGFPLILLSTGEIDLDLTNYNKSKRPKEDDDNNEAKQSTPKKMKYSVSWVMFVLFFFNLFSNVLFVKLVFIIFIFAFVIIYVVS